MCCSASARARGARALAKRLVLGEPRGRGRGELRLHLDAARPDDRAAGGGRLERHPAQPLDARDEDRGRVQDRRAARGVALGARVHASGEVARDGGTADQRPRAEEHDVPARQLAQRADDAAGHDPLVRAQLDDDRLLLPRRREQRRCRRPARGRDSRPGTAPPPPRARRPRARSARRAARAASRAASGPADSRDDRRTRRWRRRARPCRGARGTRATAARDRSRGRRRSSPCASAWRRFACTPTGTPSCDRRDTGTAGPTAITSAGSPRDERPASGEQVGGPGRGREHRHRVAGGPQGRGDPRHVVVHVVRLRPRERRHQTDAHRPRA